jgi:(p)ppGpp synthase/HD superfamily hydrolase
MDLLDKATVLFAEAHKGQKRKRSGIPYYSHCLEVMKRTDRYQEETEVTHEELLIAAIGHDLIEDTDITYDDIVEIFGKATADVILECSRDPNDENQAGKYGFLMSFLDKSYASVVIKVADRVCNVLDYYSDPETAEYAATYALQAYPLLNKAYAHVTIDSKGDSKPREMSNDILKLHEIIRTQYPDFNLLRTGQEEKVREMVASDKPMKGHNKDC